jgi:hypothetical protein
VKGVRKCYILNVMDGNKDGEEIWNVSFEYERVSSECKTEDGNFEDTKYETDSRNGEYSEMGETK